MNRRVRQEKGCVVVSRGASPAGGDHGATTDDSVPDIGRSARSTPGPRPASPCPRPPCGSAPPPRSSRPSRAGRSGRMADRVETLRTLRDLRRLARPARRRLVLTLLDLWPSLDLPARNGDTGVVPVVSVTAAPVGGHSPAGYYGSAFPVDRTGASDRPSPGWSARSAVGQRHPPGPRLRDGPGARRPPERAHLPQGAGRRGRRPGGGGRGRAEPAQPGVALDPLGPDDTNTPDHARPRRDTGSPRRPRQGGPPRRGPAPQGHRGHRPRRAGGHHRPWPPPRSRSTW